MLPVAPKLTVDQKIKKIQKWQSCTWVHHLTCGKDSNHGDLTPKKEGDKVVLCCPDCDYVQNSVPDVVLASTL
ncbi:MAG: hypothetical protein COV29_00960 [Candidatus Yanofskybacteria bacterium CG10_big_fil_rev_8_21_14_0_10_36_16]|uniref:Uncharacterized protein n=1 Tax=Candidatus Yanofskybacteria bacterium CG10_big_fil_rev_8_21_14_0_10_36_16 TaxID=1975096 RepID=A0A2J0Q823_9BACT|nr:MAG: hypothetical protein COV29_00960 [Candidatus Yanofskybacteria bacterium CG10_big_fil_rev_8_21_14_0_10_36_16]